MFFFFFLIFIYQVVGQNEQIKEWGDLRLQFFKITLMVLFCT